MKKTLLFLILLAITVSECPAFKVLNAQTGVISDKEVIAPPERTVEKLSNGTKVTYTIKEVLLNSDPIFENSWYPLLEQFSLTAIEGEPWLPIKSERITCPDLVSNELQILEDSYIDVNINISPARTISINGTDIIDSPENILPINPSNLFIPSDIVNYGNSSIYRGVSIQSITLTPIQYNPNNKTLRVHNKFSYLLSSSAPMADEKFEKITAPIIANVDIRVLEPIEEALFLREKQAPISYLILTPTSLDSWATELHYWKQHMGYDVILDIRDKWTSTSIKDRITEFYNSTPDAYYVLLVGDNNLMPSMYIKSPLNNGYLYSDMYYACMDGPEDTMPDLIYGRIPASTSDELKAVVKKIMEYETKPNGTKSETNFMAAAYFQDLDSNGIEDVYFTRTAETICTALEPTFDKITRVYCHDAGITPCAWSKYTIGLDFPENLKKVDAWGGSKNDIINSINNGCNIALHRDHGTTSGWADPSFLTRDLTNLDNSIYPIVFSINCSSGNYTVKGNFAKELLCKSSAGASAVIGATTTSYSQLNDVLSLAMMNSIWPDKSFRYYNSNGQFDNTFKTPSYTIGEALQVGLCRMEDAFPQYPQYTLHEKLEFHCLGDPSLYIYWGADSNLEKNLNISYKDGYVTVFIPGTENYYISFWEAMSKRKQRSYGNYSKFQTNIPDETSVYIYKNGAKPIHQYSNIPYPPQRSFFKEPIVSNISFNSFNEVEIELDGDTDGSTLTISEADNLLSARPFSYSVTETTVTHQIQNSGCHFFIISLSKNGEILYSKTIFKK